MTSAANSVGMEAPEGGRNALKTPPHEAVERLAEIAAAVEFAPGDGISFREAGAVQHAADLRTVLSHLRQVEEREAVKDGEIARLREALNATSKRNRTLARNLRGKRARAALTHSPETDGEG